MDPATLDLVIQGVVAAAKLLEEAQAAYAENDQAALDVIHQKAVAAANALAPDGGIAPVPVA